MFDRDSDSYSKKPHSCSIFSGTLNGVTFLESRGEISFKTGWSIFVVWRDVDDSMRTKNNSENLAS
jgi:hypothetical protein